MTVKFFYPGEKNGVTVDLNTAIIMSGLGKFHIALAIVGGGCLGSYTTDNLGISFVLPDVACELKLSAFDKGILSGAMYMGMVLTGYSWGFASDTFGRRGVLIVSLGTYWLASFLASLVPIFWLMVCLRFLGGAAVSGAGPTVFAYLGEFLPEKQRATYLSFSGIFIGIGFCVIPATAWLILPLAWSFDLGFVVVRSWRILCLLNGSYILMAFLGMLYLPESPKYLVSMKRHEEAIEMLRKVFSINTGRPPNEYPVLAIINTAEDDRPDGICATDKSSLMTILRRMKNQFRQLFGSEYVYTTILVSVIEFSVIASSYGFYHWVPDSLNRMINYNRANPNSRRTFCTAMAQQASSNTTCQSEMNPAVYVSALATGGYYCVGCLLIAILVNFVSRKPLLAVLQFVSGIAIFGLHWASDAISVTIATTVYMAESGLCLVLLNSAISDLYPTHIRSTALCIAVTAGRLGSSAAGAVIGVLFEYDCAATIYGFGITSIATGLLVFLIPERSAKMTARVT